MSKRALKAPIRFTACLPLALSQQRKYASVTKQIWLTYPENLRGKWANHHTKPWYVIIELPPYANPYLERLRRKLGRQGVAFTEQHYIESGVEFARICTEG